MSNSDIVNRFLREVQSEGKLEVIEELMAPDFLDHNARPDVPAGREGVRLAMAQLRAAIPDLRIEIDDQMELDGRVITRKTMSGTHSGPLFGVAATGNTIRAEVIDIVRDGRLRERWGLVDQLGLLQQIGAVPVPS